MTQKEKGRPSVSGTQDGRGKQKGKTSPIIVRQSGYPVNGFPCGFHREVYELLSNPITIKEIAVATESTIDRVCLAIHDLEACGVKIGRPQHG